MRPEDSVKWRISVCGLNCAKCDIYEASHGNEKLLGEMIEWFRKERNETVTQDQIRCDGCRGPLDVHWSPDCKMMLCAKKRGLQHCFQCENFPCTIVNRFSSDGISHHKRTIKNSEKMKEIGIGAWIKEQKRKGQCTFCP